VCKLTISGAYLTFTSCCYALNNSGCRQTASERIPGRIENYVTRVSERSQRTCDLECDGYIPNQRR